MKERHFHRRRLHRRHIEEGIVKALMVLSFMLLAGSLGFILITILIKGLPASIGTC